MKPIEKSKQGSKANSPTASGENIEKFDMERANSANANEVEEPLLNKEKSDPITSHLDKEPTVGGNNKSRQDMTLGSTSHGNAD